MESSLAPRESAAAEHCAVPLVVSPIVVPAADFPRDTSAPAATPSPVWTERELAAGLVDKTGPADFLFPPPVFLRPAMHTKYLAALRTASALVGEASLAHWARRRLRA